MRILSLSFLSLSVATALVGCGDDPKKPIGDSCESTSQCESGECLANVCLDPEADTDGDGLVNRTEVALGTSPVDIDTDGDGVNDYDEVGGDWTNAVDTDGDGKPDAIESATLDADGDCITDQLDADDATPESDAAKRALVMCNRTGVCAGTGATASCTDLVLNCDYSGVEGYEADETSCDGLDNDCDGAVDERYAEGGEVTFDGGPFAADGGKYLGQSCGAGACADGEVVCDPANAGALTCSTLDAVGAPTCNQDNDCNGTIDVGEDIAGCVPYYIDGEDADGFGSGDSRCLCGPDTTHTTAKGGDCDETRNDVYPGAAPLCGVDSDCAEGLVDVGEPCDDGNDDPFDGCDACATSLVRVAGPDSDAGLQGLVRAADGGWFGLWNVYFYDPQTNTSTTTQYVDIYGGDGTLVGDQSYVLPSDVYVASYGPLGDGIISFVSRSFLDPQTQTWMYELAYRVVDANGVVVPETGGVIDLGDPAPTYFSIRDDAWMPYDGGGILAIKNDYYSETCQTNECQAMRWYSFGADGKITGTRSDFAVELVDFYYGLAFARGPAGGAFIGQRVTTFDPGTETESVIFRIHRVPSATAAVEALFVVPCPADTWCSSPSLAVVGTDRMWVGFSVERIDPVTENYVTTYQAGLYDATGTMIGEPVVFPSNEWDTYSSGYFQMFASGTGDVWAFSNGNQERGRNATPKDNSPKADGDFEPDGASLPMIEVATRDGSVVRIVDIQGFSDMRCAIVSDGGAICFAEHSGSIEVSPEVWEYFRNHYAVRYGADGVRVLLKDVVPVVNE